MQGFEEAAVISSVDGLGYQIEQRIVHKGDPAAVTDKSIEAQALAAVGIKGDKRAAPRQGIDPYGGGGGGGGGSDSFEDLGMAAAAAAAGVSKKPLSLRDQLAANKAAAEEAWKEKHNPFKPPPGLDEDDFHRYEDLELARRSRHEQAREQDAQDFTQFQIAVLQQKEMSVKAIADADATPVGAAVPLPEPENMLDPSLRFGPAARAAAGAALLAPLSPLLSPASASASASGASASALSTPAVAAMPTLVLLKRKHSSSEDHHGHSHSHSHGHGHNGTATGAGSASSSSKDGGEKKKKSKKHRKDKDADAAATTATAPSAATPAAPAAAAVAAEPAESGLAGLIGAYGSDDDE